VPSHCFRSSAHLFAAVSPRTMMQLSAQQKHDILVHCEHRQQGETEVDVAAQHGASVSRETIWRWRRRWDRTPQSLEHAPTSGRPRILTPSQVSRHVRAPILAANRRHEAVSYAKLLPSVRQKTRTKIALRTLQQLGKEQLQIKSRTTRKRTRDERQYTHTCARE
jgi:transposase